MLVEYQPLKGPKWSQGILGRGAGMRMAPALIQKSVGSFPGRGQFDLIMDKNPLTRWIYSTAKDSLKFQVDQFGSRSFSARWNRGKQTADHGLLGQAKVADKEDLFQLGKAQKIENDVVLRGTTQSKDILLEVLCHLKVAMHYL
jgi:hypothetical protein